MKKKLRVKNLYKKLLFFLLSCIFHFSLFTAVEAKVYIDITSPEIKKLPIAVQEFSGDEGKMLSDIIKDDLDFTGLFICIDRAMYIEKPGQPFNPQNWTVISVDAVIKGTITSGQTITATASLHDVIEGREILKKEYKGEKNSTRQIAHKIANDIYRQITGENGIFSTKIAFVAEDEGKKGLYVMDWDGTGIKRLGIRGNFVLTPNWSKDGSKIVYSSERNGSWGIYLLDFTKMTEKNIFVADGLNMTGNFFPDSDEIMFASSKDETYGLYTLKITEARVSRITATRWIDISPAVSPDGKQVAFVSDRGGTPQIYIMDRNGYDVRRLSFEGSYNTSPSWAPNNTQVVFVGRVAGKHHIFVINSDGSGLVQLTDKGDNEDPSFSPDGRYIIFSSNRDGTNGIFTMKANGESQKRISPTWLKAFGPRWSPN